MCKKKRSYGGPVLGVGSMGDGSCSRDTHPRAYHAWYGMLAKCYNVKCPGYESDGALGARVCDEWLDFPTFAAWFEAHDYDCPVRKALTRRLGSGKLYGPDTCALVPVDLLPAVPVYVPSPGGMVRMGREAYAARVTLRGRMITGKRRTTPEEARADYMDIRAGILDSETGRLDAMLTDGIRALAAAKSAQLRAEADRLRAAAAAKKAARAYEQALENTPINEPVMPPG